MILKRAARIVVEGRVQDVGYRVFVAREAGRLHLHGFVRNRSDGSVETLVEGPADKVEEFVVLPARGPKAVIIESCRIEDASDETLAELTSLAGDHGAEGFFSAPTI